MGIMKNLIDQTFGRLVAIYPTNKRQNRHVIWLCRCICGNLVEVTSDSLLSKNTQSCGCLHREKATGQIKHGDSARRRIARLYTIWKGMKQRCLYQKYHAYKRYGGRGISICKEWRDNYQAFKIWALGSGYTSNLTIDRIDNDGNYEPSNCQWLTLFENGKKGNRKT